MDAKAQTMVERVNYAKTKAELGLLSILHCIGVLLKICLQDRISRSHKYATG